MAPRFARLVVLGLTLGAALPSPAATVVVRLATSQETVTLVVLNRTGNVGERIGCVRPRRASGVGPGRVHARERRARESQSPASTRETNMRLSHWCLRNRCGWRTPTTALVLTALLLTPATALAQTTTQVIEYYTTDALGSVRAVTKKVDGTWQVVSRHHFMPFGEEVAPPPPPSDKRLFTGKERDSETGMDYFGARYYRANVGRFTTVDPLMTIKENLVDPQRWNRYAYAKNGPLRFLDPDGRYTTDCAKNDGACRETALRFEKVRLTLLGKDATHDAADAFGDLDKANGVKVHFNLDDGSAYDGYTDPEGSAPNNPNINVWIKPSLNDTKYARAVAHEGTHVQDDMRFINSGFDQRFNFTHLQSEMHAFTVGATIARYTQATLCAGRPCTFEFGPLDKGKMETYLLTDPYYASMASRFVFPRR